MRSTLMLILAAAACSSAPARTTDPAPTSGPPVAAEPAPTAAAHTPPKLRLPAGVRPLSYAITMRMSPTQEKFSGTVDVEIQVAQPTDIVWIHAGDNLAITTAAAGDRAARVERPASHDDLAGLVFAAPLPAGAHKLRIAYDGKLPAREDSGAYRQDENGVWYIFTQFESTDARRAFPCFDEPGFKVPYTIALEVPQDQLAFANTPQIGEAPAGAGWKRVSFAKSKPLPTYLIAFAVGPFEVVDAGKGGANGVPIRIIVPKGRSAEAAYAVKTTAEVVNRLEAYFGIPYPYEKIDHIAVPAKRGAMENPGLITYGTNTMLGKPADKSLRLERGYLGIAAHELGHIWFGDLVTLAWWDDIWLNEAFATWIAAKIVHQWHPEWEGLVRAEDAGDGAMRTDALVTSRRIRQPIESKHDIANAFDGITYQKGGAVIAMMEAFVGEEPFRKGVHEYLRKHAHSTATSTDFLRDVGAHSGKPDVFAPAFASFLDQPGVPLVTAELVCEGKAPPKLQLAQQRYLPVGSAGGAEQTWKIPVCASYPSGGGVAKSCTLLEGASGELALADAKTCPAWVNPNAGSTGYYRVAYKGDLLARLLKEAQRGKNGKGLAVHERVGVLNDALALVRSGQAQDGEILAHVPALVQEGNRHLVGLTVELVGELAERLVTDETRPNYRRFVAKTFTARAKQLGWRAKGKEDDGARLLRPGLLSLVSRDETNAFAAEARKLAEAWLVDRKAIEHDLVGTVLAVAARNGDRALWDKLRAQAKQAADRTERLQLLGAMASFKDPQLVAQNLQIALTDEFDPREAMLLVFGGGERGMRPLARTSEVRQLAYDFVKKNFDALAARLPRDGGAGLSRAAAGFCDAEHRADAERFFTERVARYTGGPRILAQILEGISLCQAQHAARLASVTAFLKKY